MGSLRDALVAALTLDTFNRHAEKVDMACVAQLVNNLHSLFLADGDRFVATPTYHVYTMYRAHQNATAVRMKVEADDVTFQADGRVKPLFRVAGSASVAGQALTITLVHTHASDSVEVDIRLDGGQATGVRRTVLTHTTLNAHNTFAQPATVVPKTTDEALHGHGFRVTLPPASVTRFDIRLG